MAVVPEFMPMLSPGKHRSARSGGCFMEIASFLAGDPWSDHPKCTDPALAEVSRCVNDVMPDSARSLLAPMIPSVIGTGGRSRDDRMRIAASVVRECTLVGLPLVSVKTRPLACALLVAEEVLDESTGAAAAALATQPEAADFARRFLRDNPKGWREHRSYLSLAAPEAVRCAVRTVSEELGDEAPDILARMLARAIGAVHAECGLAGDYDLPEQDWKRACDLVGAFPRAAVASTNGEDAG